MTRRVPDLLRGPGLACSFEFFPPKDDAGELQLWQTIAGLSGLRPAFVSITDGAGGSTRERTARMVVRIAEETDITPVAHLTCVGASRHELEATLDRYARAGIGNVLALRGDPPADRPDFSPAPDGFAHADGLVRMIREQTDLCVGVAAYPDKHPASPTIDSDTRFLVDKIRAGADFVVTQFFFEPDRYFELVDRLTRHGVTVPVIPGIMPITNVGQIERFARLQGSPLPAPLVARLRAVESDPHAVRQAGVETATDLCRRLIEGGAPGLHFYTLNRSSATREIARNLGLVGAR